MRSLYLYLYLKMHLALMGESLRFKEELEGVMYHLYLYLYLLVYVLHITLAYILVRLWEPDGRRIAALTVDTGGEEKELRLPACAHLSNGNGGNLDQINLYLYLCIKL